MNDSNIYAVANIEGDISSPNLKGLAYFKPFKDGTMVEIEINGLPALKNYEIFPIHIHDGQNCNTVNGIFANVGGHYNPTNQNHPYHAGDMPPLFSNNGYAYLKFYTTRFKVYEIVNKLVIIHEATGNAENPTIFGRKIGCGLVEKFTTI